MQRCGSAPCSVALAGRAGTGEYSAGPCATRRARARRPADQRRETLEPTSTQMPEPLRLRLRPRLRLRSAQTAGISSTSTESWGSTTLSRCRRTRSQRRGTQGSRAGLASYPRAAHPGRRTTPSVLPPWRGDTGARAGAGRAARGAPRRHERTGTLLGHGAAQRGPRADGRAVRRACERDPRGGPAGSTHRDAQRSAGLAVPVALMSRAVDRPQSCRDGVLRGQRGRVQVWRRIPADLMLLVFVIVAPAATGRGPSPALCNGWRC